MITCYKLTRICCLTCMTCEEYLLTINKFSQLNWNFMKIPAESEEETEEEEFEEESEEVDVEDGLCDVRWRLMLVKDDIDDLFDKNYNERRAQRRFNKQYNQIADD